MVKMMTLLVTFETLEADPSLSLDSPVRITKTALEVPRTGIIWLDPRETFPLSDLLKAVTIKSANDAATQVAEFIGKGSVDILRSPDEPPRFRTRHDRLQFRLSLRTER